MVEQGDKTSQASEIDETLKENISVAEGESVQSQNVPKDSPSATTSTLSISKTAKCRFTEVARCMLEIIEDLQLKNMLPETAAKDSSISTLTSTSETVKSSEVPSENTTVDLDSATTDSKSQLYTSASEYHVYEEIAYDFVGQPTILKAPEVPPPLPARPTTMLPKSEQYRARAPSPPPRKSRCTQKRSLNNSVDEPNVSEVRNRPKQRGNLYCLFADRTERRKISKSLEREFKVAGPDDQEDDYGFKKEFPSI